MADCAAAEVTVGSTWNSARRETESTVIGLCSANPCNHEGIVETGTKMPDANVSGNIQMNPPDWAASTLRTESPTKAETQENAKLTPATKRTAPANSSGLL